MVQRLRCRSGDQHLATMTNAHQTGGTVHRWSEIIIVTVNRLASAAVNASVSVSNAATSEDFVVEFQRGGHALGLLMRGIRALDLSISRAGAYCTRMLAAVGAEVVVGESATGSPLRAAMPVGDSKVRVMSGPSTAMSLQHWRRTRVSLLQ